MADETILCPYCGSAVSRTDAVCRGCGRLLTAPAELPPPFTGYPPPFSAETAVETPAPPTVTPPTQPLIPPAPPPVIPEASVPAQPEPPVPIETEPEDVAPITVPAAPVFEPLAPVPPGPPASHPESARSILEGLNLSPNVAAAVMDLVRSGRKIAAIQLLADKGHMDLHAAKGYTEALDAVWDSGPSTGAPAPDPFFVPPAPAAPPREHLSPSTANLVPGLNLPQSVVTAMYALTMRGQRIQAIQVLRENSNLGLGEAKDAVDRLAALIGAPVVRQTQCYIATACYGDSEHPDVVALRRFRDEVLLPNAWGRAFVTAYYTASPAVARRICRHSLASRLLRRILLEPLARRHR